MKGPGFEGISGPAAQQKNPGRPKLLPEHPVSPELVSPCRLRFTSVVAELPLSDWCLSIQKLAAELIFLCSPGLTSQVDMTLTPYPLFSSQDAQSPSSFEQRKASPSCVCYCM